MNFTHTWMFPLVRTHSGMLQGNGTMGVMLWGGGRTLKVTVGRADYWDHRGGLHWTPQQSYKNIRNCLENNDEKGLRALFEQIPSKPGYPEQPSVIPVGRFEFIFSAGTRLSHAVLRMHDGEIDIFFKTRNGIRKAAAFIEMQHNTWQLKLPAGLQPPQIRILPAWELLREQFEMKRGFSAPRTILRAGITGWVQPLPEDPALATGCRIKGRHLVLSTAMGNSLTAAENALDKEINRAEEKPAALRTTNRTWWRNYWKRVPQITLPNQNLMFLYHYGMYKFAGLTNPTGTPATLQGPWVEEYQMPPWSNDYHFNINVQMCYWPTYHGNCLEHLPPLFKMIESWLPQLRKNAEYFLGIKDGIMLPHAVDDRCTCMGGFWTGTIDHGCTAWVAQMMFRYYLYSGNKAFLKKTAYPFMQGAMRVYEAMLQKQPDGSYVLPVSVSPEYRGAAMNAWGRNASFQLACIHRLLEDLQAACTVLNLPPKRIWRDIQRKLPKACVENEKISLWENVPLEESHRHHSHLAGISPFDILDPLDSAWQKIIENSIKDWIGRGAGRWSGWCIPWAAMLHTRTGNPAAAEFWLEIWQKVYTNEGHGTLHDADFPGFTLIYNGYYQANSPEKMQMDAGMACTTTIQEMLLHTVRGENVIFGGAPEKWKNASFTNMLTEGGFLVSAARRNGLATIVTVKATRNGVFRFRCPWTGVSRELLMKKGQTAKINKL